MNISDGYPNSDSIQTINISQQYKLPKLIVQDENKCQRISLSPMGEKPFERRSRNTSFYNTCKLNNHNNQSNFMNSNVLNDEVSQKEQYNISTSKKNSLTEKDKDNKEQVIWSKLDEIMKRIKFKTYIKKLLFLSRKRLYRLLNYNQVQLINDKTNYYQSGQQDGGNAILKKRQFQYIPKFFRKQFAQIPIFLPNNTFLEIWQIIKIVCVIICVYFYLICFAFNLSIESTLPAELNFLCQICLATDILVNLNTAIYLKGQLTMSRRCIYQQYKKSFALYSDIIQLICFIIYIIVRLFGYSSSRSTLALLLPIVFKHNDLNIIIKKLKNRFLLQKKAQNAFELISLLKNILLISHIFACIWILIAKLSEDISFSLIHSTEKGSSGAIQSTSNWITLMNIHEETWIVQYLYAYYFITVTMITVGYGDVRPTNPLEVGICIYLMMTCCLIFGFTINSIGEIFQDIFRKEKNILQKRCIIANYMQRKDIDSSTQKCIFEYLEYYWREELDENLGELEKILSQLSNNLKEELQFESSKLILKENKILKDHFSNDVLVKCLPIIQEQNCTPGEVIVDDQIGNIECFLYFVQQGELEVYQSSSNGLVEVHTIKKLQKVYNIKYYSESSQLFNYFMQMYYLKKKETQYIIKHKFSQNVFQIFLFQPFNKSQQNKIQINYDQNENFKRRQYSVQFNLNKLYLKRSHMINYLIINQGNNFGQRSFFSGEKQCLSVRSINFSTLLKIKRSDFIQILQTHQSEFETFCMIKDRVIFSDFCTQLYEKCTSCGEITHNEITCPVVHFIPKKFKILALNQISYPHLERKQTERYYQKKQNTLLYLDYNLMRYYEYLENDLYHIEDYEFQHFEYQVFKKNITMNEIDEASLKELSIQANQFQNHQITQIKEAAIETPLSSLQKRRLTFIQRLQGKNTMNNQRKSQELDERDEASSKNIQSNLYDSIDIDKDIALNVNQNRLSFSKSIQNIQKDKKKKISNLNSSMFSPDIEPSQADIGSPMYVEKAQSQHYRQSLFQNNQYPSKDLNQKEFVQNVQKNSDVISIQVPSRITDIQSNQIYFGSKSIQLPVNPDFDIFQGQFEQLFTYKNYFPKYNFKEIIQQANLYQSNQKNGRSNTQKGNTKKDSQLLFRGRRNGKRMSNGNSKYRSSKITNKFLNSPGNSVCNDQSSRMSAIPDRILSNICNIQDQDDSKLVQSPSSNNISLPNQSALFKDIKIEIESLKADEEQTHLRRSPSACFPKKFYLSENQNEKFFTKNTNEFLCSNLTSDHSQSIIFTREFQ